MERSVGGKHGGGTALTDHGRRVIAMYRAVGRNTRKPSTASPSASFWWRGGQHGARVPDAAAAHVDAHQRTNQFVRAITGLRAR